MKAWCQFKESPQQMHVNFIPFQIYFFQLSRALVASSPEELQAMLDIVATYADKWQYQLNADKSKQHKLLNRTKKATYI